MLSFWIIKLELTHQVSRLVTHPSDLGLCHLYNCVSQFLIVNLFINIYMYINILLYSDFVAPRINKPTANEM